jgi:hypothetical protein
MSGTNHVNDDPSKFEIKFPAVNKVLKILEHRYHRNERQTRIPYDIGHHVKYNGIAAKTSKRCETTYPTKRVKKFDRTETVTEVPLMTSYEK